jgi:superfamily II DNA helicase RecQ
MTALPPSFITVNPDFRVAICSQHGCSYVRANLRQHLRDTHLIHSNNTREIPAYITSLDIANKINEVSRPGDGVEIVSGLPVHSGYKCTARGEHCRFITIHEPTIKEHCRTVHHIKAVAKGRPRNGTSNEAKFTLVRVQTLFTRKQYIDYFVVNPEEDGQTNTEERVDHTIIGTEQQRQEQQERNQANPEGNTARTLLQQSYEKAQEEHTQQYNVVSKVENAAELSKWLQETGYQDHIEGIEVAEFAPSYELPNEEAEPVLSAICSSIARVFRGAMEVVDFDKSEVRRLTRINSRLLNTLVPNAIAMKPFRGLQSKQAKDEYIRTFQKLLCYYSRVSQGTHLQAKKMFVPTSGQRVTWSSAEEWAQIVVEEARENEKGFDRESVDKLTLAEERLDRATLSFSLELLRHELSERVFDSAIISWLVVLAWDTQLNTWMRVNYYTSYLSHIIYDCRLLLLQHCIRAVKEDSSKTFTEYLLQFRDKWIVDGTHGPVGEVLSTRLLARAYSKNTVEEAKVYWSDDGNTIVYQDIELPLQGLSDIVRYALSSAVTIFKRDICFELDGVPEYAIKDIAENINERRPGASFITDIRNAARFDDGLSWLFQRVVRTPALSESFIQYTKDESWYVQSTAVTQYEAAVQQFLEYLFVVIHIASGQPSRRPDILQMRWCNKQSDSRTIFIRDGYVIFALRIGKTMHMTNAASIPVRVLLPEAAVLLVQYLVLVVPFRRWLLSEIRGSHCVSEYLWSNDTGIWPESRMTRIFQSVSLQAIGIDLNMQQYRQIAIGVAIKKFAGIKLDEGIESGSDSEDEGLSKMEGSMPAVFHLQASHTERTGNQAYGGTVNFKRGLTDAAIQEFIRAGVMWQTLFRETEKGSGRKHDRSKSANALGPLAKRIALRGPKQQCRRHWSMEEAKVVLRTLHPAGKYRTSKQEQAVQAIVHGLTPVVAILGTGEGKSLLYMLQQKLPGAGITVLLVPLVSLRHDTIDKCRRIGIDVRVWGQDMDSGTGNSLVIASLDQAVGKGSIGFQNYLHKLNVSGQLNAIVVDECHLFVTAASYRDKMAMVKDLRVYHCQLVFLTATMPISLMTQFTGCLLLASPVVIRSLTVRKNLTYGVKIAPTSNLVESGIIEMRRAMEVVELFATDEHARGVIYCRTKVDVDNVADEMDCLRYYSDYATEEEKADVLQSWMDGNSRLVVATTAFTEGIDYHSVRLVCYIGPPESAVEFVQGVGRAGRDGGGGVCFVVVSKGWKSRVRGRNGELMPEDAIAMERFLDGPRCRVQPLGLFLDGVAQYCDKFEHACDLCTFDGMVGEDEMEEETEAYQRRCNAENAIGIQAGEEREAGVERLRAHKMEQEERLQIFIQQLDLVRGRCLICLARGKRDGMEHSLDECREQEKRSFFQAKKRATGGGKKWIMDYKACFRCGLHQTICSQQGQSGCRYKDIIMPLSWSGFGVAGWEKHIEVVSGRKFIREEEYMRWLGQGARVFEEEANNMVLVGSGMLNRIVKNLLE